MYNIDRIDTNKPYRIWCYNDEKKSIELRKQVNQMYFTHHISKNAIACKKGVSKKFVIRWTQSPDQDLIEDNRGWGRGIRRKWDSATEKRIKEIHTYLTTDPCQFYTGAIAILQEWNERYHAIPPPPLRTIGKILSDLGLSKQRKQHKNKGAARYLCYPEYTIYNTLGKRILEADFIGKKFITGRTTPINFIGFSFKKEPRLRYFKRIEGQTAWHFIHECHEFFQKFEKPDCIKIDNSSTMTGSISGKRNISKAMAFLLKNQIIPIFAVPRKPFSQASIEGNNSVFSRKFWNKIEFNNINEIDERLASFNIASQRYTGYKPVQAITNVTFIPRVYFIRQVIEGKKDAGLIYVLNEKILLPPSYIHYFVLAEWNITEEQLYIYFEKEQKSELIEKVAFPINERSKKSFKRVVTFYIAYDR